MGKITISMAIFNSYVKLPEGNIYVYSKTHPNGRDHHADRLKCLVSRLNEKWKYLNQAMENHHLL